MARASGYETRATTAAAAATVALRRISWSAVIGGVVIALVTQFLLSMLGVGIGVSTLDPMRAESPEASTFSIAAAVWWTVSGIIAAFLGGWVAGRLAGIPEGASGALHGLLSWATTTLVVFYLLTTAVGALVGGAFGVLGSALSGAGEAVRAVAPQLASVTQGPLADLRQEIESATGGGDPATRAQLVSTVIRVVTGGDNVSQADRDQAVTLFAQQTGMSPDEARNRLTQWTNTYRQFAAETERRGRAAAERTAEVVAQAAIYGFIALVLGAIAAAIGGRTGAPRERLLVTTPVD